MNHETFVEQKRISKMVSKGIKCILQNRRQMWFAKKGECQIYVVCKKGDKYGQQKSECQIWSTKKVPNIVCKKGSVK